MWALVANKVGMADWPTFTDVDRMAVDPARLRDTPTMINGPVSWMWRLGALQVEVSRIKKKVGARGSGQYVAVKSVGGEEDNEYRCR